MSRTKTRTPDYPEAVSTILDKMPETIKSGEAEVRLKDHKRTGSIAVRSYTNPQSGEEVPFLDQFGKDRVVKITRNKRYDLSNVNQRLEFFHIMNHPVYVLGPTPVLLVVNHETDAEDTVLQKDLEADANGIARKLKGEDLRDFARIMLVGKRIIINDRTSDAVIKRALYEAIEEDPAEVIRQYEDPDKALKIVMRKGLENGTFTEKDKVYAFGTQRMGITFDQAIEWLKDNEDILPQIRKQVNSK